MVHAAKVKPNGATKPPARKRKPAAVPLEAAPAPPVVVEAPPAPPIVEMSSPAVTHEELLRAARILGHSDPAGFLETLPVERWQDLASTAMALRQRSEEQTLETLILAGAAAPAGEASRYLARAAALVRTIQAGRS